MKKPVWIPPVALFAGLAGIVAWVLRWRLLQTATGDTGLLTAGHPLAILSCVLTAAVVILTAVALWKHRKEKFVLRITTGSEGFRVLAMVMVAMALWNHSPLGKAAAVAALIAAAAALVRMLLGKKQLSPALADIPALLFYILCLCTFYRVWSAEPEAQRYAYSLLAIVCLMFATYSRSAVVLELGKHALFLGSGFLGVYFAFAAAADPGFAVATVPMAVWMMLQLDTVTEAA